MISQSSYLVGLGLCRNRVVLFIPGWSFRIVWPILPVLPVRTATPSGHNQNSLLVSQFKEILRLQLPFQPDRIQVHIFHVLQLGSQSFGQVSQEHIRGPAAPPYKNVLAVDLEYAVV